MTYYNKLVVVIALIVCQSIVAQQILINKHDAEVWTQSLYINGELIDFTNTEGTVSVNGIESQYNIIDDLFTVNVKLTEGENLIFFTVMNEGTSIISDSLILELAYNIRPELYAYASVENDLVYLHAQIVDNPDSSTLTYEWSAGQQNPAELSISNPNDTLASVTFPASAPNGEYYFNLFSLTSNGDTVRAATFVTVKGDSIIQFHIKHDHAAWIDSAIIYEVTPYIFTVRGSFNDINNKVEDFVRLGINTLWIQPVFGTANGGQGYDITNYFKVRSDLGTKAELKSLIDNAKAHGLRVIFDFVPNHSSIHHRYAQNTITYGEDSHYWEFYQRVEDDVPYSQHYHHNGNFIYYFWTELPNLNYHNPETRRWISEAARYWVEEFDIDGYRFDAVWGTNARNPDFMKELRLTLKRLKPDVLMLAEDKATWESTFDENFDLAFDWTPEESWVSHWVWQTSYSETGNPTIFNYPLENMRSQLLRESLTNNENGYSPTAKILRFIGNNDIYHFITHHGLERTKMVAAMMFTLHGVPMIYNGQEIGVEGHPYETEFLFFPGFPIDYNDPYNLFPFYQRLIEIRKEYPALTSDNFQEVIVSPDNTVFSYRRWTGDENIFTIINMKSASVSAAVQIPVDALSLDSSKTYYMTELISGEIISGMPDELYSVSIDMDRFSTKVFVLADSIVHVTDIEERNYDSGIVYEFDLKQNYPNPFNPLTNIEFSLPSIADVKLEIYNVIGERVRTLVDANLNAGVHRVQFNASTLPSGVYLYRITNQNNSLTKKMILIK
ncbi:MAG: T9SS type A sorting domain-containing protein [Melioribacteraceae bacterium]|nr:T9SS type A sorting domain-containing protein [Melioribacteraceae bacterium]MCF8353529.1 T9SS type A sorting domain-containing protein [Melioribacteraceae bacterium]MCF8392537.1 T9SS type A sorting domain-containing protein [Melioribacteraceae bacterium]MCF8418448.1 T9SS type A sorting domain-containing protein [Melioribacteraceae bacterium]